MAIPVRLTPEGLEVAFAEPSPDVRERVAVAAGHPIVARVATITDVRQMLDREYRALAGVSAFVGAFEATRQLAVAAAETGDLGLDDAPVVQVVNLVLTQGLRDRASDIHVEPQEGRAGVAPGTEHLIFDRFATMDGLGGTGLGLPIARGVARVHGGDLTYEDGTFVLRLPLATYGAP